MASIRSRKTADGSTYYEIRVRMGRGRPELSTRWYPAEGWSQHTIDRELTKAAAEYERRCKAGEIVTRKERQERAREEAEKASQVLTVRKYAENYLNQANIAESTRDGYQRVLDNWIYPAIGDMRITDVTADDIDNLLSGLQNSGKAHSSCVKCYAVLSGMFKKAYKKDVVPKNPMDKVDRPKPRKDELVSDEPDSCTVEEVRYVLECLAKEPLHWQVYVRLLLDTGCRRGELTALKWSAVDFKNSQIEIAANACYTPKAGTYIDTPKNRRKRTIDIWPETLALLKKIKREQTKSGIVSQFVFPKKDHPNEPMFPTAPTKYLARFSERYGIHVYPHKMRHTYASLAITNGADVASVSENLGHSDTSVTLKVYTEANKESRKRASDIVREAIKAG